MPEPKFAKPKSKPEDLSRFLTKEERIRAKPKPKRTMKKGPEGRMQPVGPDPVKPRSPKSKFQQDYNSKPKPRGPRKMLRSMGKSKPKATTTGMSPRGQKDPTRWPKAKPTGISPRGQKDPTRRPKAKPTGILPRGQKETPTKSLRDKLKHSLDLRAVGDRIRQRRVNYLVKQYAQRKKHPTTPRTR